MTEFNCTCVRGIHRAPFEKAEISRGALEKLPEILQELPQNIRRCRSKHFRGRGKRVCEILQNVGMLSHFYVLDGENILPNAETLGKILLHAHDPNAKSDILPIRRCRILSLRSVRERSMTAAGWFPTG